VRAREGRRRGSKAGVSAYLYIARIADFFSVIEAFSILAEL
jgi:hypothetical protein